MGDSTTTMKRGDVAMNYHQRSKDVKHASTMDVHVGHGFGYSGLSIAAWENDPQKKLTLFPLFGIG